MNKQLMMGAVIIALSLSGCISKDTGMANDVEIDWKIGITTRRDVVEKWGNPDKIEKNTWIWKDKDEIGGKLKASYMMIGVSVENMQSIEREYQLTFDKSGKLIKMTKAAARPGGAEWSMNVWD